METNMLKGKKALIVGLASNRSIAYGIAEAFHNHGAELAFTYQNDKLKERVIKFAENWGSKITIPCDLSNDIQIKNVFTNLKQSWNNFDIIIHSAAFAPADQLDRDYLECVNREGFLTAHDISSYSLAALAKSGYEMMNKNGAILTLSYIGAEKVVPNYNVMGIAKASLEANVRYLAYSLGPKNIRVNGISAGPIRTLAAAGIKNFRKMLSHNEKINPLRKNLTIEEVGNTAAFLCSDMSSAITGEIVHVDNGFHILGMPSISEE